MGEGLRIIVGLGNPGKQYQNTRHNAGYMALAAMARLRDLDDPSRRGRSLVTNGRIEGRKVLLAWPQTFMNNSGQAVGELLGFYKLPTSSLLVIHDDMDVALGRLKASSGGGCGGHNGVISIQGEIGPEFDRLRVGIGRPPKGAFGGDYAPYVLSSFTASEGEIIDPALLLAAQAAVLWTFKGMAACQRKANVRPKPPKEETGNEAGGEPGKKALEDGPESPEGRQELKSQ
ncbi:MAG: aminoacyl-tRNA hydrolase [Deltaproteobacteria bacterium]|nr:aminoacyl-tRNA hydrolase [Deltaproteobacteria bacterium]